MISSFFSFLKDALGDLFWPAMAIFGGVLLVKTFLAIVTDANKHLRIVAALIGLGMASACAETTVLPDDVASPLGTWGGDSNALGEAKMVRDEARLTNSLLAFIIGGQWAAICFRNVRA